jgi:hypothetical protein
MVWKWPAAYESVIIPSLPLTEGPPPPTMLEHYPDHARLIGCFIGEWTVLEYKLVCVADMFLSMQGGALAQVVYQLKSSRMRVDSLELLMTGIPEKTELALELIEILGEAKKLLKIRDDYAHHLFGRSPDTADLLKVGVTKDDHHAVTLDDLTHQFNRLKRVSHRTGQVFALRDNERRQELSR